MGGRKSLRSRERQHGVSDQFSRLFAHVPGSCIRRLRRGIGTHGQSLTIFHENSSKIPARVVATIGGTDLVTGTSYEDWEATGVSDQLLIWKAETNSNLLFGGDASTDSGDGDERRHVL